MLRTHGHCEAQSRRKIGWSETRAVAFLSCATATVGVPVSPSAPASAGLFFVLCRLPRLALTSEKTETREASAKQR
jgi:hypothetical protein